MPVYTYRCRECSHEFELRQRMTDDPMEECPVCGGVVRRVVNSVGVVFKGSGFYVTDNRNGRRSTTGDSSKEKTAGSEVKTDTTSTVQKDKKAADKTPARKAAADS